MKIYYLIIIKYTYFRFIQPLKWFRFFKVNLRFLKYKIKIIKFIIGQLL
jgi:hypothetical protein